jgi:hypothetical protein
MKSNVSHKMRRQYMETKKYVYWQEDDMWVGYLEEYPNYMTQGKTIEELKENLKDIYKELTSGAIPCVRKVAELEVV